MSEVTATNLKRLQWRLEWLVQVGVESVISRLPGEMVFRTGEVLGGLLWHVMGVRRRIVLRNLRIAYAEEKGIDELRELAKDSFRRSVANLLSAMHTASLDLDSLEACVTVENPEVAEEAVKLGNGILFLPPHMGNWEILARMNRLYPEGHQAGAFYRPLSNPYLDVRLAERRRSEGTRLFSKRDSLHQVGGFLKNGGMIGILADQRAGRRGVVTEFFGRLTRSSPLPELLCRRCKSPLIAISLKTVSAGKWTIRYHKVDEPSDTAACMRAIEGAMRVSPVDVFWFQDRWKISIKRDYTVRDWLGDEDVRSSGSGHRALVWLVGLSESWRVPFGWEHGDVRNEYVAEEGVDLPQWLDKGALVHRVGKLRSVKDFRRVIARIDANDPLPLDWVLAASDDGKLKAACRSEAVPLVVTKFEKGANDDNQSQV